MFAEIIFSKKLLIFNGKYFHIRFKEYINKTVYSRSKILLQFEPEPSASKPYRIMAPTLAPPKGCRAAGGSGSGSATIKITVFFVCFCSIVIFVLGICLFI
jgi:hypothetical protein